MTTTSNATFPPLTPASAPAGAQDAMRRTAERLGYLPDAVARMAAAPSLLTTFLRLTQVFDATSLDPTEREVVVLVVATRHRCHVCVAMHSARLRAIGAPPELVDDLRAQRPLTDPRLEALRAFTVRLLVTAGDVDDTTLDALLRAGYSAQQALEVVLGVGAYTLSTFANRLTGARLDEPFADDDWSTELTT